jgi:hypothetical protein
MNTADFWKRFRRQFSNEEWDKLNESERFKKALLESDEIKAGLIADEILIGKSQTKVYAKRLKEDQKRSGLDAANSSN